MMIKLGDAYIAHNACMIKYMTERWGVSPEKIINLQIFDYLLKKNAEKKMDENYVNGIIVAWKFERKNQEYIYNLDVMIYLIVYVNGWIKMKESQILSIKDLLLQKNFRII